MACNGAPSHSQVRAQHSDSKILIKEMEKDYVKGRAAVAMRVGEQLADGPLKAKHRGVWDRLIGSALHSSGMTASLSAF